VSACHEVAMRATRRWRRSARSTSQKTKRTVPPCNAVWSPPRDFTVMRRSSEHAHHSMELEPSTKLPRRSNARTVEPLPPIRIGQWKPSRHFATFSSGEMCRIRITATASLAAVSYRGGFFHCPRPPSRPCIGAIPCLPRSANRLVTGQAKRPSGRSPCAPADASVLSPNSPVPDAGDKRRPLSILKISTAFTLGSFESTRFSHCHWSFRRHHLVVDLLAVVEPLIDRAYPRGEP